MAQDSTNLIWIDLEMSGLRPEADTILEVALVVTTQNLQVVAEGPVRLTGFFSRFLNPFLRH